MTKMTKTITHIIIIILLFVGNTFAQNPTFEEKAKQLSIKIDSITIAEKKLLKKDIRAIEKLYNNNKITLEEAEQQKIDATSLHANNIKTEVAKIETELHDLVQNRVDNKVVSENSNKIVFEISKDGVKIFKQNQKKNRRTYPYTVLAFGLNNLVNDDDINSIQDTEFEFGGSRFFEFGINYKTRIFKQASVPYINYGLSVRYNNLRFKDDKFFITDENQTIIAEHPQSLKKSNFKNVQLVVPVMLELDFSKPKIKDGKKIFRRNRNFRFGFGGFGGINLKSKQVLKYRLDGKRIKDKTRGDFNVNNFVYGLNAFIGWDDTSFYVKYDLQDLFKDSFKDQKNISFGVRFDL
jgi:hypothetical protein